jgi:hypothetical protein
VASGSDDDLISSIAPDVMKWLGRRDFFEKLSGLLSPENRSSAQTQGVWSSSVGGIL